MSGFIYWLIAGAIGGYLAGFILKGDSEFNKIDLVIGLLGAIVGGLIFRSGDLIWNTITAFLGAVLLVLLYEKITGREAM